MTRELLSPWQRFLFVIAVLLCLTVMPVDGTGDNLATAQDEIVANDPQPKSIKVATWNVEWFFDHYQGDNSSDLSKELSAPSPQDWEWKVDVIAQSIAAMKPTILGLQEIENRRVLEDLARVLKEKHGLSYRVAFVEGFDKSTEQDVGILFRDGLVEFSRLEQSGPMYRSQQYYSLSKHLVARFRWGDGEDTEELIVVVVHLRARAEEAALRIKQCKLIRYWLNDLHRLTPNIIVMGDLNTEEIAGRLQPDSELALLLRGPSDSTDDDFFDLLEKAQDNKQRTHLLLDKQFDRILASPNLLQDELQRSDLVFKSLNVSSELNVRGQGVDEKQMHWESYWKIDATERDISDHHPVVAEFEFIR